MHRRLTIPALLGVTLVVACTEPTVADSGTDSSIDSNVTCADPNALPTESDLGCWTCDPPTARTYTNLANPSDSCGLCSNPMAQFQPRGGCGRCEPADGGVPYVYC